MEDPVVYYHRRRSLIFPLLLIAVGAVFLLNNIGLLPGTFWEAAGRFWPVLLIIFSLDDLYRGGGLAGATFWMGLGVVFLLINLNVLPWDIWDILLRFWPVIIILAGVDIMLGRRMRSGWGALAGFVIALAVLGGILWYANANTIAGQRLEGQSVQVPLEGSSSAMVNISPAAANTRIQGFNSNQYLVDGSVKSSQKGDVRQEKETQSGSTNFSLKSQGVSLYQPFGKNSTNNWDIKLNQNVPIDLAFSMGVGEATLNLKDMNLTDLSVDSAIGLVTITLPTSGNLSIKLNGAIGETIIVIPAGANAQISVNSGIASLDVKGNLLRNGNLVTTPGFNPNRPHLDVQAGEAIGNVTIRSE